MRLISDTLARLLIGLCNCYEPVRAAVRFLNRVGSNSPGEEWGVYYHGSPDKIDVLRAGSWVTPYIEDAHAFGIGWSSDDLVDCGGADGRPPLDLQFRPGCEPADAPLNIYSVYAPVRAADTNTGHHYDWNRQTTRDARVVLVASYPSWKQYARLY